MVPPINQNKDYRVKNDENEKRAKKEEQRRRE